MKTVHGDPGSIDQKQKTKRDAMYQVFNTVIPITHGESMRLTIK